MFFFFDDDNAPTAIPSLTGMMPADVRTVGEAVYGHAWQRQLTERISALRTDDGPIAATAVYGWAAGKRRIPGYVSPMLAKVLEEGEADLVRRLSTVRSMLKRIAKLPPPEVREPRGKLKV